MPAIPESLGGISWRVARRCNGGECVRIAVNGDAIVLGDTKRPDGPVMFYSRAEWAAFVEGIRQGDFDDLF